MDSHEKAKHPDNDALHRISHLEQSTRHLEDRLATLGQSVAGLRNVNLETHKWHMTLLFTLMTVVGTLIFGGLDFSLPKQRANQGLNCVTI